RPRDDGEAAAAAARRAVARARAARRARDLRDPPSHERSGHDDRGRRAERVACAFRRVPRVRPRDRSRRARRPVGGAALERIGPPELPRVLMTNFLQQVVSGLASGGIYGLLALAIVLINRATGVLNFAQGEMATLSAFICLSLINHGWGFWTAFAAPLLRSFAS